MAKPSRKGLRSTPKIFNASYQTPKKQINWQIARVFLPGFWLAIIIALFILIPRLPVFRIANVQITGTTDKDIILTLNQLKGQSIFTHNLQKVETELTNNFFSLKGVECRRGIPNTLRCQITLREPGMIWKTGADQYLVDKQGVVYSKIITLTDADKQNLIYIEDKRNVEARLGELIVNHEILDTMTQAVTLFKDRGYQIGSLAVDESFYQFTVNLTSAKENEPFPSVSPLPVIMTTSYAIKSQVAAVAEILKTKSPEIKNQIDLRVQGYAYYK